MKLVFRGLQALEALLGIFEQAPAIRVRDEVLRLPPAIEPIEAGTFLLKEFGENTENHVTASRGVQVTMVSAADVWPSAVTVTSSPAVSPGSRVESMMIWVSVTAPGGTAVI